MSSNFALRKAVGPYSTLNKWEVEVRLGKIYLVVIFHPNHSLYHLMTAPSTD